ncbi:hypothetical protein [Candidatus Nitrosacidococcus sp. I8]|uniref:hypothetical protein n=1 Tax=Candidatus Nitrosacidococcus sp. I8 TaxID=2942908 RepID=UPI002227FA04|nr:hypothetical protein [Candidatus Nitrosacidococcus sp. I8]CAH9019024.1 hypothetical protein NURINAE_01284 [Candidatus Nitrosacidococcus sp. I8]
MNNQKRLSFAKNIFLGILISTIIFSPTTTNNPTDKAFTKDVAETLNNIIDNTTQVISIPIALNNAAAHWEDFIFNNPNDQDESSIFNITSESVINDDFVMPQNHQYIGAYISDPRFVSTNKGSSPYATTHPNVIPNQGTQGGYGFMNNGFPNLGNNQSPSGFDINSFTHPNNGITNTSTDSTGLVSMAEVNVGRASIAEINTSRVSKDSHKFSDSFYHSRMLNSGENNCCFNTVTTEHNQPDTSDVYSIHSMGHDHNALCFYPCIEKDSTYHGVISPTDSIYHNNYKDLARTTQNTITASNQTTDLVMPFSTENTKEDSTIPVSIESTRENFASYPSIPEPTTWMTMLQGLLLLFYSRISRCQTNITIV